MQSDQSMHSSHTTDFYQIRLIHITCKFLGGGGGGGGGGGEGGEGLQGLSIIQR